MLEAVVLILVLLLMLVGVLGAVLPAIPSAPLILIGAFLYGLATGFEQVSWAVLVWLLLLTLLSQLLDYLATVYGAKRMNASTWGILGAFVGTIVGLFAGGLLGAIVGPFLGAFACEMLIAGRDVRDSFRSGVGSFLGFLGGALGKLVIAMAMCGIFAWALF